MTLNFSISLKSNVVWQIDALSMADGDDDTEIDERRDLGLEGKSSRFLTRWLFCGIRTFVPQQFCRPSRNDQLYEKPRQLFINLNRTLKLIVQLLKNIAQKKKKMLSIQML